MATMLRAKQKKKLPQKPAVTGSKPRQMSARAKRRQEDAAKVIDLGLRSSELSSHRLDHQHALEEAKQAMELAESVYSDDAMELIAPYVQVGSAYLGVGSTKNAEKYLTQAHWLALKSEEPLPAVLEAKMHRSLGRLYLARDKLAESLAHFAEDVYFSSCAFEPLDPQCCTGYFHMAIIFETHDEQRCKAYRALVSRIWRSYLFRVFLATEREGDDEAATSDGPDLELDPVLEAECERHLQFLFSLHCTQDPLDEVGANVCLATLLLMFVRGEANSINVKEMLVRILKSGVDRTDEVKVQARQLRDRMHSALDALEENMEEEEEEDKQEEQPQIEGNEAEEDEKQQQHKAEEMQETGPEHGADTNAGENDDEGNEDTMPPDLDDGQQLEDEEEATPASAEDEEAAEHNHVDGAENGGQEDDTARSEEQRESAATDEHAQATQHNTSGRDGATEEAKPELENEEEQKESGSETDEQRGGAHDGVGEHNRTADTSSEDQRASTDAVEGQDQQEAEEGREENADAEETHKAEEQTEEEEEAGGEERSSDEADGEQDEKRAVEGAQGTQDQADTTRESTSPPA